MESRENSNLIGLVILFLGLCVYVTASYAYIITLSSIAMLITLYGLIIYIYGFQTFQRLLFPLCFLIFMIPIPAQIYSRLTNPLQVFVTKISTDISMLLNIPVFRQGNVIELPGQTLEVVQACSGLRSVSSLLALSAIFGYLMVNSNFLRTIIFFSSIPTAIVVNIVRVMFIILASYYFRYNLYNGTTHTIFSVVIFGLALTLLFLFGKGLSFWDKSKPEN
jgi:exosortase